MGNIAGSDPVKVLFYIRGSRGQACVIVVIGGLSIGKLTKDGAGSKI